MKNSFNNINKYRFLMSQLVIRDFKLKYKRSVLGIIWSVLNPLLMMFVMSIVFSQMFKFNVPGVNYLVYLLTGLVLFNYFSEASNMAMGSIIGNFTLINKVYIPKYIFPIAKCLFIGINFLLTLIPLYLIIIFSGSGDTKCVISSLHFLLPFVFICLFMFTLGVGFILATLSVFLRDIIYIYSIVILILTYATPIMYDISMINPNYMQLFKLNPLYQYINFAREIILFNRMPTAEHFFVCMGSALLFLIIGIFVFKKNQDKFIYYA